MPDAVRMWGVWCDQEQTFVSWHQWKEVAIDRAQGMDSMCCQHRIISGTFVPDAEVEDEKETA